MKKSIFFLAAGALALTACTSEDVVYESLNKQAIGFTNVVDKQTRSESVDITGESLNKFSVFGYYTLANNTNSGILVFNNEVVTKRTEEGSSQTKWTYDNERYWVPGATYYFYAYNCGNVEKLSTSYGNFAMDVTKGQAKDRALKINGYICDESHQHDLLFATKQVTPATDDNGNIVGNQDVAFKFDHLLAKIDAKFISAFAPEYTIRVNEVTVTNIRNKGDYDCMDLNSPWSNVIRQDMTGNVTPYVLLHGAEDAPLNESNERINNDLIAQKGGTVTDVNGVSTTYTEKTPTSNHGYVIPYDYKNDPVTLSFKITIMKDDQVVLGRTLSGSWRPSWVPGHWYTYTINITGDATNLKPIVFTTDTDPVTGWSQDASTPEDITFSAN